MNTEFYKCRNQLVTKKMTKLPYLCSGASKSKSETTLFLPTLKVEAYKVVSDFDLEAQGESYGHFVVFKLWVYIFLGGRC